MPIPSGTHEFGPGNGTLSLRTGRTGAAAKAGHNLLIDVTVWQATLTVGDDPADTGIALAADPTSLRVREGTGGMQALGDDDKASIQQTIDDEVLQRKDIRFRSTAVQIAVDGGLVSVRGELTMVDQTCPIGVDLTVGDDGRLSGSTVVRQSDWGITPYSTLFGALKVVDEVDVEIVVDPSLRRADAGHVAEVPEPSHPTARRGRFRAPSIDPRVSSFLWALMFFLFLWFGMLAVGVSHGTAVLFALVASFFIFVFVRTQGAGRKP